MKGKILEDVYEMECESKLMYGVEMWALDEGWKEVDTTLATFL